MEGRLLYTLHGHQVRGNSLVLSGMEWGRGADLMPVQVKVQLREPSFGTNCGPFTACAME